MTKDDVALPPTSLGKVLIATQMTLFVAGTMLWVWLGEWRLFLTALVVIFGLALLAAHVDSPAQRALHALGRCGACGRPAESSPGGGDR